MRFASFEMTYIGHMNEFQLARPFKSMIVTSEGRAIGTSTFQRYVQLLAPSIRVGERSPR